MRKNTDQKNSEYVHFLHSVSRQFFFQKAKAAHEFVLSGYGINDYGPLEYIEFYYGIVLNRTSLNSLTKEVDARVVQHILNIKLKNCFALWRFNDEDVLVL